MATIAVFLGLGGGAYAALTLPKNSVGPRQIAKNAVRSGEVKNNALTGKDVLERRLGVVPSALTAQRALNADLLGGSGPDAFARSDRVVTARATARWDASNTETGQTVPVLNKGPFSITLNCKYAANTAGTVSLTTTAPNSSYTSSGAGNILGPSSPAQTLASATVPAADPNSDSATAGSPFSLYSPSDGTYLAGHVAVFATDTGQECRALLSGISG